MPCLRKEIWKVTKKCENSSKFGKIDIEEVAKNLDSIHLLTVVYLIINILGRLKI